MIGNRLQNNELKMKQDQQVMVNMENSLEQKSSQCWSFTKTYTKSMQLLSSQKHVIIDCLFINKFMKQGLVDHVTT
jgi:aspartate carbamoyltransferase regulatory subunit